MSKPTETELPSQEDSWAIRKEEKQRQKQLKQKAEKEERRGSKKDADSDILLKRKREPLPEEVEIDVNLAEPVSRKELRKAKKAKSNPKAGEDGEGETTVKKEEAVKPGERSQYGVWIGNLPWSATKDSLRTFLMENTEITSEQITRVHMPAPTKPPNPNWSTKPLNKGFAYVDFSDQLPMYAAIALTETKMDGRPLLIKNAKSFEGRPEKPKEEGAVATDGVKGGKAGHPPNKRVFVGNLAFDVTKEDLEVHFSQAGPIEMLHMATFEDTGKCKGYAWVTFETVEAATSAVQGFILKAEPVKEVVKKSKKSKKPKKEKKDSDAESDSAADSSSEAESSEEEEEPAPKKAPKPRKWWINQLMGRELRCEFAEDASTRYNKRYGKEKKGPEGPPVEGVHPDRQTNFGGGGDDRPVRRAPRQQGKPREERKPGERGERGHKKRDPRTIAPGAAHTNAQRAAVGIVPSEGKKITFD